MIIQCVRIQLIGIIHVLKTDADDLLGGYAACKQLTLILLQQRTFAGTADTGNDLDDLHILPTHELVKIACAFNFIHSVKFENRCKDTIKIWNNCNIFQTFCKKSSFLKHISYFCAQK